MDRINRFRLAAFQTPRPIRGAETTGLSGSRVH